MHLSGGLIYPTLSNNYIIYFIQFLTDFDVGGWCLNELAIDCLSNFDPMESVPRLKIGLRRERYEILTPRLPCSVICAPSRKVH